MPPNRLQRLLSESVCTERPARTTLRPTNVAITTERPTDVRTLEDACRARVLAVNGTAFPEPHVRVAPGDEVRVVGTGRGLAELERRVAGRERC